MVKDKRKKDAPTATETSSNPNSTTKDYTTLCRKSQVNREQRTRNFATIVYPDSAPKDWIEKLNQLHVAALISPLHDKDKNPSGEPKKPHYHVMIMFEGKKDYENQIKPIFDEIGGVGRETVNSARGYARYLCHLDNPEKAQYEPSEVRCMGGADYTDITNLPTDNRKMLADIMGYIQENEIFSFAEFIDLSRIYHPDWFNLVVNTSGWIVKEFIKSLEWERSTGYVRKTENSPKVDKQTGEILDTE